MGIGLPPICPLDMSLKNIGIMVEERNHWSTCCPWWWARFLATHGVTGRTVEKRTKGGRVNNPKFDKPFEKTLRNIDKAPVKYYGKTTIDFTLCPQQVQPPWLVITSPYFRTEERRIDRAALMPTNQYNPLCDRDWETR